MNIRTFHKPLLGLVLGLLLLGLGSCSVKNIVYFQDVPSDTTKMDVPAAAFTEPTIQPDDILSVQVQTLDPVRQRLLIKLRRYRR